MARTDGDRLFLQPYDSRVEGDTTYEMARTDTTLTLSFVGTSEPTTDGVPGAVWHRAFYTVAPFTHD
ncbi:hypothetical protein [Nocardioides sp. B-3]|uniref:hypothetical protein n=1 Tax=Nocardioides sp. B-3 TaxID=2895565 RepID=UPI00215291B0|nr:hypothetical protein [Nocardioides sp. B-3]UUZ58419.1 hypothetical protein LP418_19825 [Nocardioides sp. B-3]